MYLSLAEEELLADLVDEKITSLTRAIHEERYELHWLAASIRAAGPRPRRSDINQLLPEPEMEYQFKLQDWEQRYTWFRRHLTAIREMQATRRRLQHLLNKLEAA